MQSKYKHQPTYEVHNAYMHASTSNPWGGEDVRTVAGFEHEFMFFLVDPLFGKELA